MHAVQRGPLTGLVWQLVLLCALAAWVGLGGTGWVVGVTTALVVTVALQRAWVRHGVVAFTAADRVTLARATLACGVAALVADGLDRPAHVGVLVLLAAVALPLDAVDGWMARRTETASAFGARFDMEVDAFLILALSVYVAHAVGLWVLVIGAARYALVVAGRVLPWLREDAPPRYWCKVVAAVQGVVLTVVAADVVPRAWAVTLLVCCLALLVESFGREGWWLWRHREAAVPSLAAAR